MEAIPYKFLKSRGVLQPPTVNVVKDHPAGIYLLKVNNRDTRAKYEICSKLTIKTQERYHWPRSGGAFIVNFEHISHLFLVVLLITLNM